MQGVAQYVHLFEDPVDTPPLTVVETRAERRDRRKKERAEQVRRQDVLIQETGVAINSC